MNGDRFSHGLWEASAPAAPVTQALDGDIHADVVIVGAGYTGLSSALHCAQAGMSVVVLEAQEIGFGGSGRNVGLVNAGMWVMPEKLPAALGDIHGNRLLRALGDGPNTVFEIVSRYGIDCQATRQGTLHCAVGASGLRDIQERARQWQALGAPVRVLNAQETTQLTGSQAYAGALLDERAGTIQPLAYARGLAQAALQEGAKIYTGCSVQAVQDLGSSWQLHTAHGSVTADKVIVATNAYTAHGAPWQALTTEMVKLPYFNLATAPLPEALQASILPQRQGAWDTANVMSSFRFDQAGRLVFGGVGALRGLGKKVHHDWAQRAMTKLFPQLEGMAFEHQWYGWIAMTDNNLPRLHHLARNTYSFSGFNGRGISPGTVFGKEMAQLISGSRGLESLSLPVTPITSLGLRPVRQQFYEQGATAAHLVGARF